MSTSATFKLLQERGSPWLKSKVLYADHRAIVLNKPPNFVCQLRRPTTDTGVCLSSCTFMRNWVTDSDTTPSVWSQGSFYGFNEVMNGELSLMSFASQNLKKEWLSDIKTSLNLNEGPYPVHRLDKVDPILKLLYYYLNNSGERERRAASLLL